MSSCCWKFLSFVYQVVTNDEFCKNDQGMNTIFAEFILTVFSKPGSPDRIIGSDRRIGSSDRNIGSDHRIGSSDRIIGSLDHRIGSSDRTIGSSDRIIGSDHWIGSSDRIIIGSDHRIGPSDRIGSYHKIKIR